jgi:hypothetical protein
MMRNKNLSPQNYVPQTAKYAWVAAATLIVALILGAFAGIPPVAAGSDSIDADAARYQAMGEYYLAQAGAGRERAIDADSARWAALGSSYAQASAALSYTDVSRFYAERMRAQAHQASSSMPYTDVSRFYAERMRAQASQRSTLAANPELMFARRSYAAAANMLAANPELMAARRSYGAAANALAANPELMAARGWYDRGSAGCSPSDDILVANPELAYVRQARSC